MDSWIRALQGLREGRLEAFDHFSNFITGYLAALGAYQARDSWDDLVQDVLIALLQNPPESQDSGAIASHVRTTTYRKYVDYIRRERGRRRRKGEASVGWKSKVPLDEVPNLADPHASWENPPEPGLRDALARLDERKRRVIECRYFLGHSNEEGAAHTGDSLATYKRLLAAALEELRQVLVPRGELM